MCLLAYPSYCVVLSDFYVYTNPVALLSLTSVLDYQDVLGSVRTTKRWLDGSAVRSSVPCENLRGGGLTLVLLALIAS